MEKADALCNSLEEYLKFSVKNGLDDLFIFQRAIDAYADWKGITAIDAHQQLFTDAKL